MNNAQLLAIFSALATLGLMLCEYKASQRGRWIFKPLASILFVATGFAAGGMGTAPGHLIVIGLILGALGDVLLIPKKKLTFLIGLGTFLLGHVFYALAFLEKGVETKTALLALIPLIPLVGVIGRWLLPNVEAAMRMPVMAYMIVITGMVALALGTWSAHGTTVWLIAAIAFFASDLAVARDQFIKPGFSNKVWGLPLYYGAQIAFALNAAV